MFSVKEVSSSIAMQMVMDNHYSQRKVGARYSFGLYTTSGIAGCCVYSIPASFTLCKGVCGDEYKSKVLELSRLVVTTNAKNAASELIGKSLRLLAGFGDWVIVSYADCNTHVGHVGYVYQATNWIYTGHATAEPKWIHPKTGEVVSYTRRHIDRKAEAIGLDWKQLIQEKQVGKHRYCTFAGSKKFKKQARLKLAYQVKPYPKGESTRHVIKKEHNEQLQLVFKSEVECIS